MSSERLYTSDEVSDIVRARLAKARGIPGEVLRDMLVTLADRVDDLEEANARLERRVIELEHR
jgi:hypothetical protein